MTLTGSASILVAPGRKTRIDVRITRTGPRRPVALHLAGVGTDFVAPDVTVPAANDTASLLVTASQAVSSQQKSGTVEAKDGSLVASTPLTLAGAREMTDPGFGKQGAVTLGQPIQDVPRTRARRLRLRGLEAAAVEAKLRARSEARVAKDFAHADALRKQIADWGVEVFDGVDGATSWKINI